ncbi:MAG: DUF1684 domain-containing protein [Bacteroidetes bacterium]|nr:DUF1684 domain-containing protein [Bacteroidota bacterium]
MKKIILIFLIFTFCIRFTNAQSYTKQVQLVQQEMNHHFADSAKTPLTKEDFLQFKQLDFFPIDSFYCIKAKFVRTPDEIPFPMKTTTSRMPMYVKYGEAYFELSGVKCRLNIYQNQDLIKKEGYQDYLFLPFTDATNGDESYGGGRYIDLKISADDIIIIDFNKAYNPYCAYNHKYSCPIPPSENNLSIEIKAGVKKFH